MSWKVWGQGQFPPWGMEPAEARATETEGWQAAGKSHFRVVSGQVYQYLPRMGFSVESMEWDVS